MVDRQPLPPSPPLFRFQPLPSALRLFSPLSDANLPHQVIQIGDQKQTHNRQPYHHKQRREPGLELEGELGQPQAEASRPAQQINTPLSHRRHPFYSLCL
jgi:hypothetical protein